MRALPLALAALSMLALTGPGAVPAAATHCAGNPMVQEALCIAGEDAPPVLAVVGRAAVCLVALTPPLFWTSCVDEATTASCGLAYAVASDHGVYLPLPVLGSCSSVYPL